METLIRLNEQELVGEPLPFYCFYALYFADDTYKAEVTFTDAYSFENCLTDTEIYEVGDQDLSTHLQVPVSQIDQHVEEMDEVQFFRLIMYLKKDF